MPEHEVTHLVLALNGAAITGVDEALDNEWFDEEMQRFQPLADELGKQFIGIRSNVTILNSYKTFLKGGDAIVTCAFIHAMRKLFGRYYWSSTYSADVLAFDVIDGGYMEPFVLPLISVEKLRFYHSGSETNRVGKIKYIADNAIVQKGLTVCARPVNCGRCFKCLRTMAELYANGKLELYSQVFPVDDYKRNLTSRLADEFAVDHPPFTTDIKAALKDNHIRIPVTVYLKLWFWYKPYYFFKRLLRNNKFMIKIWYGYGFDKKIGGVSHDERYVKARMDGKV